MNVPRRLLTNATAIIGMSVAAACGADSRSETTGSTPALESRVADSQIDIHSFARPAEARVTHVHLVLNADFKAKRLGGRALLTIAREQGVREVVLDTRSLEIQAVGVVRPQAETAAW